MGSVENVESVRTGHKAGKEGFVGKTKRLTLSDTESNMTWPAIPKPHKYQIHVLIIGTLPVSLESNSDRCWTGRACRCHQDCLGRTQGHNSRSGATAC